MLRRNGVRKGSTDKPSKTVKLKEVTEDKQKTHKFTEGQKRQLITEKSDLDIKIKALTERKAELALRIQSIAEAEGALNDKGSFNLVFEMDGEKFNFAKQKRSSKKFNEDKAKKFFKNPDFSKYKKEVTITKEHISENLVEKLLVAKKLTFDDLEYMIDTKETYAGVLTKLKKEEEPDMGQDLPKVKQANKRTLSRGGAKK